MALRIPSRPGLFGRALSVAALACFAVTLIGLTTMTPAAAQTDFFKFEQRPNKQQKRPAAKSGAKGDKQMMVQATEVQYDHVNERVNAVGNVQIYYDGSTIEADKVSYNQKTKRLRAEGNVRLTEPGGNITYGDILELNDDYRDGFVDSLRVETPDQTRFAAARGDRSDGRVSVLQSGVYTACEACKTDPRKPPLWQVKGARIIHDEQEKMIYFEQGTLEFFGTPIAYFPYFSTPDPTVKRKSGWLMPIFSNSTKLGFTAEAPYFWALAPNYDLTLTPSVSTKQGPFMQAEFRHRLMNGAYAIRAAGIRQLDKDEFIHTNGAPTPGYRDWRGAVESNGQFGLNQRWVWGWDALLISDKTFYQDYHVSDLHQRLAQSVPERRYGRHLAALSHRPRQPFLFRRAQHLLLRFLRIRPAKAIADHPSGGGLQIRRQPAGAGRRTRLPLQHDKPLARERLVRPDQHHRVGQGLLRPEHRRSGGEEHQQLLAARRARQLFALLGRGELEEVDHRSVRPGVHAVLRRCAPTWRRSISRTSRGSRTSSRPTTPRASAACRSRGSNIAIR